MSILWGILAGLLLLAAFGVYEEDRWAYLLAAGLFAIAGSLA